MAETKRYIVDRPLDEWLEHISAEHTDVFPNSPGAGFLERYTVIAAYMNAHVHPEAEKGELLAQIREGGATFEEARYLNNHGVEHVKGVIERASDLLRELNVLISPYEAYLLLLAIHFHDSGIVYGRRDHEIGCYDIMRASEISGNLPDAPEKRDIAKMSGAHGGCRPDGRKDTIRDVSSIEPEERLGQDVRLRFLASVLRFADELADDRSRTSRFRLQDGSLPPESEIFHYYSYSLQSVRVTGGEVSLRYYLEPSTTRRTFAKSGQKIYLLDEIYDRVRKMHRERMYCMRFWPDELTRAGSIRATIEAALVPLDSGFPVEEQKISFTMREEGYPGPPADADDDCCLCLREGDDPGRLSGEELARKVKDKMAMIPNAGPEHGWSSENHTEVLP